METLYLSPLTRIRVLMLALFGHLKVRSRRAASSVGAVLMTFVVMLVAIILTPTIDDVVTEQLVNLTGPSAAIADLIPLFWVLMVLGIGAAALYNQFKGLD